jgi:hypothetical protein
VGLRGDAKIETGTIGLSLARLQQRVTAAAEVQLSLFLPCAVQSAGGKGVLCPPLKIAAFEVIFAGG